LNSALGAENFMADFAKEIVTVNIEQELKQSYLDYAMSVIVGRALPDVRDGLKPVHRRVLFSMYQLGNEWNKAHKKSARIVGDVIGKYHPHGDTAVYDTIVRMAQSFSLRYPLIDGQGNFGSIDGDAPAAMRYTEIRMAKITQLLLADLDKETVDFALNYDETEEMPIVLPTRIPNLLINGSSGIAVGMATNIPPHNIKEVIDACLLLLEDPETPFEKLIEHIQGPDFPTAGIIYGKAGIVEAYRTGRGRIFVRAKTHIETDENSGKQTIVVTELPYQVNKARLIEKIAELVKEKKIEGITLLRDESDKDGTRVIMELRRGEMSEVILNNLFAQTQLQTVFGINMVALKDNRPQILALPQILEAFLQHRREVVTRRTIFELKKSRERAHILEGLGIALTNIDEMIALIKASANPAIAKEGLLNKQWKAGIVASMLGRAGAELSRPEGLNQYYGLHEETYQLSAEQAQAILELRLHRLTGLEQDKIFAEYEEILKTIHDLLDILRDPNRLQTVIREELLAVLDEYSDARLTEIHEVEADLTIEDLITDQPMVVTISQDGYAKTQPLDQYQAQHRGGKGKSATQVKEEDFVEHLVIANSLDTLLCFSSDGKVYWIKVYKLPQASRQSKGKPLVNLLPLEENEKINTILPIREYRDDHHVLMVTSKGTIKKVNLTDFSRPRSNGIIAIDLIENDRLIGAEITDGKSEVMLFSDAGKVIRFNESIVRAMGRNARGVRGMKLAADQKVVSLLVAKQEGAILTATENGYGKRTPIEDYRETSRGGQGVISIQVSERNGKVVGAIQVTSGDEVMLISDKGTLVRIRADEVSLVGRNTQGVRLINLSGEEKLVGMERVAEIDKEDLANVESL
jgi:DNA gyrase subunit A